MEDLCETWGRITSSISGSRPPSDEDVPQRADGQGMKMDKDMSQEDWHMLFRLAYHAGTALTLDLEHDITFEGKRKDDGNLMDLPKKRKKTHWLVEEGHFAINSEPIEPHLKCDYCDKVCRGSWNASRTEWRRTCCPPRMQCTDGGDNNEVPMTTDVQKHVPCKRQRGLPSATPPPEITQMINDMRILYPGAHLKAMPWLYGPCGWAVAVTPDYKTSNDEDASTSSGAPIIDNDDDQ